MKIYLATRHPAAVEWARNHGFDNAVHVAHLDPETVQVGDVVVGSLPTHLAYDVCHRGARYLHLRVNTPRELRGAELSYDQMMELDTSIEEYCITKPAALSDAPLTDHQERLPFPEGPRMVALSPFAPDLPVPVAGRQGDTWFMVMPGLPVGADAPTFTAVASRFVDALKEYAQDWERRLRHVPGHAGNDRLLRFVLFQPREDLIDVLLNPPPSR